MVNENSAVAQEEVESGEVDGVHCKKVDGVMDETSILKQMGQLNLSGSTEEQGNNNKNNSVSTKSEKTGGNVETVARRKSDEKVRMEEKANDDKKGDNSVSDAGSESDDGNKSQHGSPKGRRLSEPCCRMSPAQFFQNSRLRSSGLARKPNTAQAFGGSADLVQEASSEVEEITKGIKSVALDKVKREDSSDGEKEKDKTDDSEDTKENDDLIGRSPVPVYANNRHIHHPYQAGQQQPKYTNYQAMPPRGQCQMKPEQAWAYSPACYMEQQRYKASYQCYPPRQACQQAPPSYSDYVNQTGQMWSPTSCSYQPQHPNQKQFIGRVNHAEPYVNISPAPAVLDCWSEAAQLVTVTGNSPMPVLSPFDLSPMLPVEEAKIEEASGKTTGGQLLMDELPDELCDFILTYSRQFSGKSAEAISNELSGEKTETKKDTISNGGTPSPSSSVDLLSPASTAFYTDSPTAVIHEEWKEVEQEQQPAAPDARQRLRESIDEKDMEAAWAWAMRCSQSRPEALFYRDKDGDSLLHIVIWHKDLAKIYVLTEIMCKTVQPGTKLFDLPNKQNETPLFLAVEKSLAHVVEYLLECGADPNIRPDHGDADLPLHYAAARGKAEIVDVLCTRVGEAINCQNGDGLTPLLCAVKNHGNLDAESRCAVNSTGVIKALLKATADPVIPDAKTGRNVIHYCVQRMDPALLQLFGDHLDRDVMASLVNSNDYKGETPLSMLTRAAKSQNNLNPDEAKLRQKMSRLLVEYSVTPRLSADDFGDLAALLSDELSTDGLQFTALEAFLTSEAY